MAIKRNRRFIEILAERHEAEERKEMRRAITAMILGLPLIGWLALV